MHARTDHLPRAGWLRPTTPGRDLPVPESRRRTWAIRSVALVALAVAVVYLAWRAAFTVALDVWWLSIPLLVLEIHAALGLALFTFSLWDVDRRPANRDVTETDQRIAVLIPTFNEGIEVLMPTVAAALAMRVPHETWILDDGDRAEVRDLAATLGARYLARPTHEHAKAGNVNHALGVVEADLVAILDADHVASPDFLVRTLGYFDDPGIALVQTPQDFYNVGSFEHEGAAGDGAASGTVQAAELERFHEQTLFYRVLQPGKNRWEAAFWCGTGAVVRTSALTAVGVVATETITEDIHTTIRLHRRGWRTVYHNEVLARGLAASDATTYQLQRHRWGTGAMQVLRTENPLVVSGLTLRQRLAYAATLLGWFDAWRSLGYLLLPVVVVLSGAVPIIAEPATFLVAFGANFLLSQLALRVLSRGCHRPVLSILFEFVRMTPNLLATLTLVTRRGATFRVTPKGRQATGRRANDVPRPLTATLVLSVVALAWYALTLLGATPTVYAIPWAVHAAVAWMFVNVALVWLAIRRIRADRFAPERRASVRFASDLAARLDGIEAWVTDLSLTGARLELPAGVELAEEGRLVVDTDRADPIVLTASIRGRWTDATGRTLVGIEFLPGQFEPRARLALLLFAGSAGPDAAPATAAASSAGDERTAAGRPASVAAEPTAA
jgi:cellulose synthase (UDP-forming)